MLSKLIGQFVIATLAVNMLPTDVSMFNIADHEGDILSTQTLQIFPEAAAREVQNYPVKVDTDSYGIVTSAPSVLVVDKESGMMLLGKRPDNIRSIGSVTKLMAGLVFLDQNPNLSQMVELDPAVDLIEGGRIYLAFYDPISLNDVLGASLVGSDNTATESLMRFSGLTQEEFVEAMNAKAQELGMTSSTFTDPTGINSYNMSTARDLVKLLRAAEENEIVSEFMTTQRLVVNHASGRAIAIENTNTLLETYLNGGEYSVTGGKTGYLPQAGYVLATSVERGDDEVYVIVLGADSKDARVDEVKGLVAWAFRVFEWR